MPCDRAEKCRHRTGSHSPCPEVTRAIQTITSAPRQRSRERRSAPRQWKDSPWVLRRRRILLPVTDLTWAIPWESLRVTPIWEGVRPFLASLVMLSITWGAPILSHEGADLRYGLADREIPFLRKTDKEGEEGAAYVSTLHDMHNSLLWLPAAALSRNALRHSSPATKCNRHCWSLHPDNKRTGPRSFSDRRVLAQPDTDKPPSSHPYYPSSSLPPPSKNQGATSPQHLVAKPAWLSCSCTAPPPPVPPEAAAPRPGFMSLGPPIPHSPSTSCAMAWRVLELCLIIGLKAAETLRRCFQHVLTCLFLRTTSERNRGMAYPGACIRPILTQGLLLRCTRGSRES